MPVDRMRGALRELTDASEEDIEELLTVATGGDGSADTIDWRSFLDLLMSV